jgi:hypothetical protein
LEVNPAMMLAIILTIAVFFDMMLRAWVPLLAPPDQTL